MVAAMEVPHDKTSSYGVIDPAEDRGNLVAAKGLVEKPKPRGRTLEPWRSSGGTSCRPESWSHSAR